MSKSEMFLCSNADKCRYICPHKRNHEWREGFCEIPKECGRGGGSCLPVSEGYNEKEHEELIEKYMLCAKSGYNACNSGSNICKNCNDFTPKESSNAPVKEDGVDKAKNSVLYCTISTKLRDDYELFKSNYDKEHIIGLVSMYLHSKIQSLISQGYEQGRKEMAEQIKEIIKTNVKYNAWGRDVIKCDRDELMGKIDTLARKEDK